MSRKVRVKKGHFFLSGVAKRERELAANAGRHDKRAANSPGRCSGTPAGQLL